jgi:hypothetical protein
MDLTAPPQPDRVDTSLELALERELEPGERILWSGGQPARINLAGFAIWLFGVPWTAFALFWMAMAATGVEATDGAGALAWAFPPFVAAGIAMLAAPFGPLLAARRVLFAVTDRRVVRIGLFGKRLWTRWVERERIDEITRTERPDGSGSLQLSLGIATDSRGTPRKFAIGEVADVIAADRALRTLVGSRT